MKTATKTITNSTVITDEIEILVNFNFYVAWTLSYWIAIELTLKAYLSKV